MGVICSSCGRDIDALGQDNMGLYDPLCEDCFGDRLGHAAPMARSLVEHERERMAVRDELDRLRRENEALKCEPKTPAQALAHARGHAFGDFEWHETKGVRGGRGTE